jgi:hypothetical protein
MSNSKLIEALEAEHQDCCIQINGLEVELKHEVGIDHAKIRIQINHYQKKLEQMNELLILCLMERITQDQFLIDIKRNPGKEIPVK